MSLRDRLKNEIAYQEGYYNQAKKNGDDVAAEKSYYTIGILDRVLRSNNETP